MSRRPPLRTFSLLLLFTCCLVSWSLQAADGQTAGPPLPESVTAHSSAGPQQAAQSDKTNNIVIPPQDSDAHPPYDKNAGAQPGEQQFGTREGSGQLSRSFSFVIQLALLIAFALAFFIPLAASRGALSREHCFIFSFALLALLVFIPLLDTSMTGAITLYFLMSGGNVTTSLAFIVGGYFILAGCTLGCFIGGLICPAKKTE